MICWPGISRSKSTTEWVADGCKCDSGSSKQGNRVLSEEYF